MRPRRLLIALATALPVAAGSATAFAADAKRLSALEVRHGELPADRQNQPGPEVTWQNRATEPSTKDGLGSCGD